MKDDCDLSEIFEKDENNKPRLRLTNLNGAVVNTLTQEEYDTLMQVYECAEWRWRVGGRIIAEKSRDLWVVNRDRTCIECRSYGVAFNSISLYKSQGYRVITPEVFYKVQGIDSEQMREIDAYFRSRVMFEDVGVQFDS